MNTIDQRIVEMEFDNQRFEKNIRTSMKSLDALKEKLHFRKVSSGLENLTSNVDKIANRFSFLGIVADTTMRRIANSAISTGKQLLSALSIDPLRSGLKEYETQIGAIQTILSNTRSKGTTIDDVNKALDELNTYADKTIYNFTEMTRNIGTFTAAGVDLRTSTDAIKGIANLAAVSGSTSQQASTAMYQLSQALASGTVKLMDWNSVVNAGMGGDVFQNALKETARVHGIEIDKMIEKEGSFRETLKDGWLTSEVLLETLKKFTGDLTKEQILSMGYTEAQAEEIIALGKDANDAATKVKTFTQLIDTLKEALGSGWTQSWELIIGNFEEARELWTGVSDAVGDIITDSAEARNSLLKTWHDAGGRTALIQGLTDTFSALWNIIETIGDAFETIFPPVTAENLLALSNSVKEFGANLKNTMRIVRGVKTTSTGKIIEENIVQPIEDLEKNLKRGMRGDEIKKLQERLIELGFDVGPAGADGIFGPKTLAGLKAFQKEYELTVDGIYGEKSHAKMAEALGIDAETISKFETVTDQISLLSPTLEKLKRIATGVFSIFKIGLKGLAFAGKIALSLISVFKPLGSALLTIGAGISDWFTNLANGTEITDKFSEWLERFQKWIEPFGRKIESVSNSLLNFFGFGDAAGEAGKKLENFTQLWNKIKTTVRNLPIWEEISESFEKLRTSFESISPELKKFYENAKTYLGEKFSAFIERTTINIPKFIEIIGKFFNKFLEWIRPFVSKIPGAIDSIKNFFVKIGTSIKSFAGKVPSYIDSIGDFFESLWEKLNASEKFQNAVKKLKEVFGSLWKAIKGLFKDESEDSKLTSMENRLDPKNILEEKIEPALTVAEKFKAILQEKIIPALEASWNTVKGIATKLGPGGIIGILAGVFGVWKIAKLVGSFTGFIGSLKALADTGTKALKQYLGGNKDSLGNTLLKIAASIGVIVAAIYFLGKMDYDVFNRGSTVLAIIVGSLFVISVILKKVCSNDVAKTFKSAGTMLTGIAAAIGVMVAAIWVLGRMDLGTIAKGFIGLIGIMAAIKIFMGSMKGINGNVQLKGFIGLAAAIYILVRVMKSIAQMDIAEYVGSLAGLIGIVFALRLLIKSMSGVSKKGTLQIKGFIGLAAAIGLLILAMKTIAKMDLGEYISGFLGLTILMLTLKAFMKTVGGMDAKAGINSLIACIGIVAIIAALGYAMKSVKDVDVGVLISFSISLAAALIGLYVVTKGIGKRQNVSDIIGSLVSLIGLTAIIIGLSHALKQVKDIPTDKMYSFGLSLAAMLLGFGVFMAIAGSVGLGGVLTAFVAILAIAAAIGLVIAAFAGLSKIDGFKEFMSGGMETIGEMFGTLVGSFESAKLSAMTKGLASVANANIDTSGLENTLACAQKISDFANGLPAVGVGHKIANFFFGSELEQFSTGMIAFGNAANSIATSLDGIKLDQTQVDAACAAAESILEIANQVEPLTVSEAIASFILGGTPFENFSNEMALFGTKVSELNTALANVDGKSLTDKVAPVTEAAGAILNIANGCSAVGISEAIASVILGGTPFENFSNEMALFGTKVSELNTALANVDGKSLTDKVAPVTEAALSIQGLADACGNISISEAIAQNIAGGTPFALFCNDMGLFASNMLKVGTSLSLVPKDLPDKVKIATSAADSVLKISNGVKPLTIENAIVNAFNGGNSAFAIFCSDMGAFGTNMQTFANGITGLPEGLETDTTTATNCATAIAGFIEAIGKLDIEKDKNAFVEFFTGDTNINTLLEKIPEFATAIETASGSFDGLSKGTFAEDTASAVGFLAGMVDAFTYTIDSLGNAEYLDTSGIKNVVNYIDDLGEQISKFSVSTADVDTTRFSSFVAAINTIMGAVTSTKDVDVKSGINKIKEAVNGIQAAFSSDDSIDVNVGSINVLCSSMITTASTYTDSFNNVGYNMGVGLANGMNRSRNLASSVAASVARSMLAAAKRAVGMNSPAKKFIEIGKFSDIGWALGLKKYSNLVDKAAANIGTSALSTARGTLSSLATVISGDINVDPVIRPVVDLSSVDAASRAMDGMLSFNRTISLNSNNSRVQSAASSMRASKASQNGSVDNDVTSNFARSDVNLTGNNFYVRSETDIHLLASEIASLTRQQQRSYGAI